MRHMEEGGLSRAILELVGDAGLRRLNRPPKRESSEDFALVDRRLPGPTFRAAVTEPFLLRTGVLGRSFLLLHGRDTTSHRKRVPQPIQPRIMRVTRLPYQG